jgi:alginate O-acetyltransferase complex protein AlgI
LNFNSLKYAVFLPIVLVLVWKCPQRWRTPILLISSYIFYMAWRPVYLFLILGLTVANYWFGKRIWNSIRHKKAWMIAAVTLNIATLAYFKYFYFLEDTFSLLAKPWLGHFDRVPINIVLPLGISFFVFEFVHYVVDVYRGSEPVREFLSFALFPSFFPTQIAGPIKRFQDFVPQLKTTPIFSLKEFDDGAFLLLSGLFKKVLLADNLSLFVSGGFNNANLFTGTDLWLFALAFDFQVYFDFGGYADIARGSAKLLGYKVPINFDFPYLSHSISEFWRRWHITLGSWLRDYLYIPLGGSRHGRVNAARNLIITMMLGGLWHGAEFHYILWGLYQGIMLAMHREFTIFRECRPRLSALFESKAGQSMSILLTFLITTIGMAIFRANDTLTAFLIVRKMLFIDGIMNTSNGFSSLAAINYPLIFPSIYVLLPVFLIGQLIAYHLQRSTDLNRSPRLLKVAYAATIALLLLAYSPDTSPRFIYYQF